MPFFQVYINSVIFCTLFYCLFIIWFSIVFRYPTSISSLSFSHDGSMLAIALSYMYENEEDLNQPEDAIFIRRVSDQETKPK